jgi:hypothetical protein
MFTYPAVAEEQIPVVLARPIPRLPQPSQTLPHVQSAAHCDGFGVAHDRFFAKAGGQWCGQTLWQLPAGAETDSLHSLQVDTKVFTTESEARVFTRRFWGYHARTPLHYSLMADHTASTPSAGTTGRGEPSIL